MTILVSAPAARCHPNSEIGRFELLLILALFGLLAGANGFRLLFNSALPCSLIVIALLAARAARGDSFASLSPYPLTLSLTLAIWCLGSAASAVYHLSERTLEHFFSGYLIPFVIYVSLVQRPLAGSQKRLVLAAVALGSMIPWVSGIIAYLDSFGFPNAVELLWNRYDRPRMDAYQRVAFGNTSHMAHYIAVVLPPLLYMAASRAASTSMRIIFAIASTAGIANLILIVSRGAILTMLALVLFWVVVSRSARLGIAAAVFVSILVWLAGDVGEASPLLAERTIEAVSGGDVVDDSIAMRIDSIVAGWRLFVEHPFLGVGPGLTHTLNAWSIAHQMAVEEAASIGIAGLVATGLLTLLVALRSIAVATRNLVLSPTDLALWSGVLGWVIYAMTAGGVLSLGLLIPWAGLLYGFLALSVPASTAELTKSK